MELGASELVQIVSGGGVLAFASAVYFELRTQRAERRSHEEQIRELLVEHRSILSALLERMRIDNGAKRRANTGPVQLRLDDDQEHNQ